MAKKKIITASLEELIAKVRSYNPQANFALIKKAYEVAKKAHQGQKRLSGDPVLSHGIAVAGFLADWRLDSASVAAGLLHDTVEDTPLTLAQVEKEFGEDVAHLVSGVTRVGKIKLRGANSEDFIENLRKMFLAMSRDLRVVLIKIADRYHNMLTLFYLPPQKRKGIAKETLEIYAPLAERLEMGHIKGELEDLAFAYVYPQEYRWLKKYAAPYYQRVQKRLKKVKRQLLYHLAENGVKAKVDGRTKHFYSLWRKLLRPDINKNMSLIHDLLALRVITSKVKDCYVALGIIHKFWRPVPYLGMRDFIAQPKPNGYQSIHTNVFLGDGRIIEIQIRTQRMHEEAEYGMAAHWYYSQVKQKSKVTSQDLESQDKKFSPDQKMAWVRQLAAWQKEITDSQDFINSVRFDALQHRIFVFSPNGDAYDLPEGATPVDFAYAVHSRLGDQIGSAKVNGKIVPLSYRLKNGQVVEIIKNKSRLYPSEDWLSFVVTRLAKKRVMQGIEKSEKLKAASKK